MRDLPSWRLRAMDEMRLAHDPARSQTRVRAWGLCEWSRARIGASAWWVSC
jgi:hypothetical protein